MRRLAWILVLCSAGAAAGPAPKSLVVCLDGLRADAVGEAATPSIGRLARGGWLSGHRTLFARGRAIEDAPSLSGPNHVAILTGVTARRHRVTSNGRRALASVAAPDYLAWLERRDPSIRTAKLVAWPPTARIPSGADVVEVGADAAVVARAAWLLAGDVDALFVFLDGPDAAGHAHGFESDAYRRAVAEADGALGRLLDVVSARPALADEDWQVVVTSDHGGLGRGHGGDSHAERAIPFLVASRHATPGDVAEVRNVDVAPTVLAHFGIEARELDGVARVPVTPR